MSKQSHTIGFLLHRIGVVGSARSRVVQGTGTPARKLTLFFLPALVAAALFAPSTASAHFTRPFLYQIAETSPGTPLVAPFGLTVDGEDNIWITQNKSGIPPFQLDEYGYPADPFLGTLAIESPETDVTAPQNLAINRSTGSFYVTGNNQFNTVEHLTYGQGFVEIFNKAGAFVKRFGPEFGFAYPHVAVDNSPEPSAGTVYVASEEGALSHQGAVYKFNAAGEAAAFSGSASYIGGEHHNEITGTPGANFHGVGDGTSPEDVAVDDHGDIYVVSEAVVDEYNPAGLFIRAFTGQETPGVGESHQTEGWGGALQGLAVDQVSDHLLVSVSNEQKGDLEGAVDEFETEGTDAGKFVNQIVEAYPGHHLRGGTLYGTFEMTVDTHGDVYVEDGEEHLIDVYGPGHFLPSLRLAESSERKPSSATLNGSVDPEGRSLSDCHFEYVTEAAYGATGFSVLGSGGEKPCVPAAGSIPVDSNFQPVSAEIIGLTSGVTYRYRLVATTSGLLGGTGESGTLAFTAPGKPLVDSMTADNLSSTFADLRAEIRPLGAYTSYHFEYDTREYQTGEGPHGVSVPVPDADIGSGGPTGGGDAGVLQQIGGLLPSTVYYFRVVASNEVGVTFGPDATFATMPQVSLGLPDGRAYELLTPPDKGSATDMFAEKETNGEFNDRDGGYPSESGDGFLLATSAAFGPFAASFANEYVFSRISSGWSYTSLASPTIGGVQTVAAESTVFDPADLSRVAFHDGVGSSESAAGTLFTNRVGSPGGPYTTLSADSVAVHEANVGRFGAGGETVLAGASRDLSHIVLESVNHTLAGKVGEGLDEGAAALYESVGGAECRTGSANCALLDVKSNGKLLSPCGALLGLGHLSGGHDAISADGSRVFFTAPDPGESSRVEGSGCWNPATVPQSNPPELYMRIGGETVEISAPEAGVSDPTGQHPALYVGASEDGSRVFFVTTTELTKDDAGIHDLELYEYDTETSKLTRVSAGESGTAAAGVFTVPAVSADGSAVYFTATGQLTGDAPETSGEQVNLYRYDTTTATTTYIATVNEEDYPNNDVSAWWAGPASDGVGHIPLALNPQASWYTTPDGRYLLFASSADLTGYSTVPANPSDCVDLPHDTQGNGHCSEVYRYDSQTGELICVSCNPSGAPPTSNAGFARWAPETPNVGPPSGISDDGSYVFFDTADALVSQDTNGTLDVYEWHEGKISLISSGHDAAPSYFLGASTDGSNVFFGTHARLVPADTDSAGDLYDARICTSSDPCIQPAAGETAQCEGGACQSPPAEPIDATPASLSFSGAGDLVSELASGKTVTTKTVVKCKKPKKLSHGKCIKAKSKKKKAKAKKSNHSKGSR